LLICLPHHCTAAQELGWSEVVLNDIDAKVKLISEGLGPDALDLSTLHLGETQGGTQGEGTPMGNGTQVGILYRITAGLPTRYCWLTPSAYSAVAADVSLQVLHSS
jgi:hypothetical protein